MKRPLISYVVTAYNIEQYIREAVECAFAQTYSPLEIVLSDDCSTDRTFEIMKEMAENYHGQHKIKLNRNGQNLGITRHMNKAYLELAEGEIIIAAHGDDVSTPERTELSYEFLLNHPDVTAVSLSMKSINSDGVKNGTDDACVDSVKFYDFESCANIPAPSRAFYKKVMTTFGPLSDDCPTEDELITTRALMMGKNAFIPNVGVYYRKHKSSSSNPENFWKFPLENILSQQIRDFDKGVNSGLISLAQAKCRITELKKGLAKRTQYRRYFANPTFFALLKLLLSPLFSIRAKKYYTISHFRRKWAGLK